MLYSDVQKLIQQNEVHIKNGIDVDFYINWNRVLKKESVRAIQNVVHSVLSKK